MPQRYDAVKRGLDVILATILMVALLPVMAVVGTLVFAVLGQPVLFRQERAGRNGQPFVILKFRTMIGGGSVGTPPSPDEARLTSLGRALRATGLDELPQLWNVLRGEMSLVGPRPLYMRYLEHYTPDQRRRHDVRPGITGLAQISGRSSIDWQQQFALDVRYVDNRSARLDGLILWRTLVTLLGLRRPPPLTDRSELAAPASANQPIKGHKPAVGNTLQDHGH